MVLLPIITIIVLLTIDYLTKINYIQMSVMVVVCGEVNISNDEGIND